MSRFVMAGPFSPPRPPARRAETFSGIGARVASPVPIPRRRAVDAVRFAGTITDVMVCTGKYRFGPRDDPAMSGLILLHAQRSMPRRRGEPASRAPRLADSGRGRVATCKACAPEWCPDPDGSGTVAHAILEQIRNYVDARDRRFASAHPWLSWGSLGGSLGGLPWSFTAFGARPRLRPRYGRSLTTPPAVSRRRASFPWRTG